MKSFLQWILRLLSGFFSPTKQSATSTTKTKKLYISIQDYMMGRDVEYPPTPTLKLNATVLIIVVNSLLEELETHQLCFYGLRSGYRPGHYNRAAGGAKNSAHLTCEAVDLSDRRDQVIGNFLLKDWELRGDRECILARFNLFMEHPQYTKGKGATPWVHLQTRKTRSGKRVFIP